MPRIMNLNDYGVTAKLQVYMQEPLDGVQVIDLKRMVDDSGSFTELLRIGKDGLPDKVFSDGRKVLQINFTTAAPGVIKAYHLHRLQWDLWFVPPTERILIVLADCRNKDFQAEQLQPDMVVKSRLAQTRRILMGDATSRLLVIPPGVAHGYKNLMNRPATLFYFVTEQFTVDPVHCEEYRLPYNLFGEDIWDLKHG